MEKMSTLKTPKVSNLNPNYDSDVMSKPSQKGGRSDRGEHQSGEKMSDSNEVSKTSKSLSKQISNLFDTQISSTWSGILEQFLHLPKLDEVFPKVNVRETDNGHQLQISAPGYDRNNFRLSVEDNVLTISNRVENESVAEDENWRRKEFKTSSFSRSFYLPDYLKADNIKAHYEDGILYIDLPRMEKGRSTKRSIEIS